jgi:predicted glycosyltransferase
MLSHSGGIVAEVRRIALYSHDAQGLGHLRRNLAIAEAVSRTPGRAVLLLPVALQAR